MCTGFLRLVLAPVSSPSGFARCQTEKKQVLTYFEVKVTYLAVSILYFMTVSYEKCRLLKMTIPGWLIHSFGTLSPLCALFCSCLPATDCRRVCLFCLFFTVPLQCLWRDSAILISKLLLAYFSYTTGSYRQGRFQGGGGGRGTTAPGEISAAPLCPPPQKKFKIKPSLAKIFC